MDKNSKIYVAGHKGLVGSALMRQLKAKGYNNLVTRTHAELDLADAVAVKNFFETEQPEYVFLAAAKVGGIHANNTYPAEFIHENLAIQNNVIHHSYLNGIKRLLFLGSSCIYPGECPQPIREEYLLTGALEPTNRPYALAKIAGIEMCWSYNRQYGTDYLAAMPTNLYGLDDNYHPENSHVIPGLIRKFHRAKAGHEKSVEIWGSGKPYREFLFADDMALACIYIISLPDEKYTPLLAKNRNNGLPPVINIGSGSDLSIEELAGMIKEVVDFNGEILFDVSKPDGTLKKLMDSSRLNQLGWQPQTPLRQGLELAYQQFKVNFSG